MIFSIPARGAEFTAQILFFYKMAVKRLGCLWGATEIATNGHTIRLSLSLGITLVLWADPYKSVRCHLQYLNFTLGPQANTCGQYPAIGL